MIVGFFVWRLLDAAFFKKDKKRSNNKSQQQDDVRFKHKPQDKGHISDNAGEYIDYEELKD